MIVSFSACLRDHQLAATNLEWMLSLDERLDYDCALSLGGGFDRNPIISAATKLFRNVTILDSGAPDTWPEGKNSAFQNVCRYFYEHKERRSFLWLEPDAIPLKKGWLRIIEEEHQRGGKPFSGFIHPSLNYMECVGVYPWNFIECSPTMGMLCRVAPWDMVAKDDIVPRAHRMNHLIQCVHSVDGFAPTFRDLSSLQHGAVLFHRNKDGTLIEQLSQGQWKRFFSFNGNGGGVVSLRRAGDIISLLPALGQMSKDKGKPTRLIVSDALAGNDYVNLLDGVSYVTPQTWHGDWEDPVKAASEFRAVNAQVTGRGMVPDLVEGNFCKDAWKRLSLTWDKYLKPQFDRRDAAREKRLLDVTFQTEKPKVLIKLNGESSPFRNREFVRDQLVMEFAEHAELIWLDDIRAERIYDLLALLERASCLVSIDTVMLHLAHATACPVIAFTNGNGFSATPPKGNCVLRMPYVDVAGRWKDIADVVGHSIRKHHDERIVHVFSQYEPRSSESKRRNAEAFATWPNLAARQHPFSVENHRSSYYIGDAYGMPFVRDMIYSAMGSGDEGIIVLSNNDIHIDPKLADEIRGQCAVHGCYWAYRIPKPGGTPDGGIDLIAFTRAWWGLHQRQYPDFLHGSIWFDNVFRRLMTWAGCQEGERLYYHPPHPGWETRREAPSITFNQRLAKEWLKTWHENES